MSDNPEPYSGVPVLLHGQRAREIRAIPPSGAPVVDARTPVYAASQPVVAVPAPVVAVEPELVEPVLEAAVPAPAGTAEDKAVFHAMVVSGKITPHDLGADLPQNHDMVPTGDAPVTEHGRGLVFTQAVPSLIVPPAVPEVVGQFATPRRRRRSKST